MIARGLTGNQGGTYYGYALYDLKNDKPIPFDEIGNGTQGPPGPQGIRGPTGPQGVQGIQGPAGPIGPQGETGIQGVTGDTGPEGPEGPQGLQGNDGAQGIQGIPGLKGDTGAKGDRGDVGPQGPQGDPGPQGATGPVGPSGATGLNWKGSYSELESYVENDAVVYEGSTYFAIAPSTGIPPAETSSYWAVMASSGAQGPQGIPGPKGDQGVEGQQGIQGLPGQKGETGDTGLQGPQGIPGIQGQEGPRGLQGPKGDTGVQGIQGIQGPKGDTGLQGPAGTNGSRFSIDVRRTTTPITVLNGQSLNIGTAPGFALLTESDAQVTLDPVTGVSKFTAQSGWRDVRFVVRIQGELSGGANQAREWRVDLRRADTTTQLASSTRVKVSGVSLDRGAIAIDSWTHGSTDPYTVDGCTLFLVNTTGVDMSVSFLEVQVKLFTNG